MGLVDYSDSEGSDAEPTPAAPKPAPAKPAFQKKVDRAEPKKIKVDLPTIKPEPGQQNGDGEDQRPAKRARTGGAFSGFNSLLPAPKGRVQSGPKPGVSLKTSSEAAFSRAPMGSTDDTPLPGSESNNGAGAAASGEKEAEPKIVGKATKFKPLSVANNKKKPVKKPKPPEEGMAKQNGTLPPESKKTESAATAQPLAASESHSVVEKPAPKPKRSLFSVQSEEVEDSASTNGGTYESMLEGTASKPASNVPSSAQSQATAQPSNPNSLSSIASDLNLTPAQRRQLFGRNARNDAGAQIAHFNMDSEYASNEQARQAGEVVEHRAVKAIAPGKHSLQQLVNNARTQQGAMEDKWAEGRRERGEAGGKYGWGK